MSVLLESRSPAALAIDTPSHRGSSRWSAARRLNDGRPVTSLSQVHVVQLSFEGPDPYASAGGLAVRVSHLAVALAAHGAPVDLYFVGDPDLPGVETRDGVTLHRWSQAISNHARVGVYDDEERKIEDWCLWLPHHLAEVVEADRAAGLSTVVLAEDWHTAWPLIALHDELCRRGTRAHAVLAWTANNRFGFDRIDFARLAGAAVVLTISRAMKHLMWGVGVNPLVVPNGIPDEVLEPVSTRDRAALRAAIGDRLLLAKVGRWDPDKRWHMAIAATARLRDRGDDAVLVARGWNGSAAASAHHDELRAHAAHLGLPWSVAHADLTGAGVVARQVAAAAATGAGVVEMAAPLTGRPLQALYGTADAVLANSGFEPFGLVGLEAMGACGVVVTGSTGEDYVWSYRNGFALDTDDADEIVRCLDWLRADATRELAIRSAAHATAGQFRWTDVVERLAMTLGLVERQASRARRTPVKGHHAAGAKTFR